MVQVLNTGVQIINVNLVEQYMTRLWYLYWYYARSITATLIKAAIIPHCRASNCSVSFPFPNLRIFLYTLPGVSFLKHVIFFLNSAQMVLYQTYNKVRRFFQFHCLLSPCPSLQGYALLLFPFLKMLCSAWGLCLQCSSSRSAQSFIFPIVGGLLRDCPLMGFCSSLYLSQNPLPSAL